MVCMLLAAATDMYMASCYKQPLPSSNSAQEKDLPSSELQPAFVPLLVEMGCVAAHVVCHTGML